MGKKSDYREWAAKQMEQVQTVQVAPWSDYEAINQLRAELAECKKERESDQAALIKQIQMRDEELTTLRQKIDSLEPVAWRWFNRKGWNTYSSVGPHDELESTPLFDLKGIKTTALRDAIENQPKEDVQAKVEASWKVLI